MNRMCCTLCLVMLILLTGCKKRSDGVEVRKEKRERIHGYYEVEVLSEPPGARIEVNDDYVGDAPLTIRMKGNSDEEVKRGYVIRALPIHPGHYVQTKFFHHYEYIDSDTIPKRIFFDMRLRRVRPNAEIDVNIHDKHKP